MNNSQIISTAMAQSATDLGCAPEDFIKDKNIIVESTADPNARKYLKLPFICDLVSYGNNIVASVDMKYKDIVEQYINRFAPEHCFETPNMHILNDAFQAHGMRVCFMAEYFLPRMESLQELSCRYELKVMYPNDFKDLYLPQEGRSWCVDKQTGAGDYKTRQSPVLLLCMVKYQICWERNKKRIQTRMGGADRKARRFR